MNKYKTYLCYNSYGATGEGHSVWLAIISAESSRAAEEEFGESFHLDNYFCQGITVLQANTKNKEKIRKILETYFSPQLVYQMMTKSLYGGYLFGGCGKVNFEYYVNFS